MNRVLMVLALSGLLPAGAAAAEGRSDLRALSGTLAGGIGNGARYARFDAPLLNNQGQIAFRGFLTPGFGGVTADDDEVLWLGAAPVAREGFAAPDAPGAVFSTFVGPVLNERGQVAYRGTLRIGAGGVVAENDTGLWLDGVLRYREGVQAPDTASGTEFSGFSAPSLDDTGRLAFEAFTRGTESFEGIWRDSSLRARSGAQAPGTAAGTLFAGFSGLSLGNGGHLAFLAALVPGSGDANSFNSSGIWTDQDVVARSDTQAPGRPDRFAADLPSVPTLDAQGRVAFAYRTPAIDGVWVDDTLVVRSGDPAPGTPAGTVFRAAFPNAFTDPLLNDAGVLAYEGRVTTGDALGAFPSEPEREYGIWAGDRLVVRSGDQAAGAPGGAVFDAPLGDLRALNENGVVLYEGSLRQDVGGVTPGNDTGLWLNGPNGETVLVVREGAVIDGRTVSGIEVLPRSGDGAGRALNDLAQVAYRAHFGDGTEGVLVFTPELRWRSGSDGAWDDASNWTLTQAPDLPHDLVIGPDVPVRVAGPAGAAQIRSLTVGGGDGVATFDLAGGRIDTSEGVVVAAGGVLTGGGRLGGAFLNRGELKPADLTIADGTLLNEGRIQGAGGSADRLNADLRNGSAGTLSIGAGEALQLRGGGHDNDGVIDVRGGGELRVEGVLKSGPGGRVFLDQGTLRAEDGLTNEGQVLVGFGGATVFGAVTNAPGGQVLLSGNAEATFLDDVENDGELRVSTGSTALFFGDVSGSGRYTGTGTKFFEGLFSPGSSPGLVTDEGATAFGATARVRMELAGLVPGTGYDRYTVAGELSLAGTLEVVLLDGFAPQAGDAFDLFDWGARSGAFDAIDLSGAMLDDGLRWELSAFSSEGVIAVAPVPLPPALLLFLGPVGLLFAAGRHRVRRAR